MNRKPEVNFIVTFQSKPNQIDRAKQEVLALLEQVSQEATCVRICFHQAPDNPARFMLYENWADKKVFEEEHSKTPYLQDFIHRSSEFMTAPMEFSFWEMVSEVKGPWGD